MPKSATRTPCAAQQDVLGFDVAMHHALPMSLPQRSRHFPGDANGLCVPSCASRRKRARTEPPSTCGIEYQSRSENTPESSTGSTFG